MVAEARVASRLAYIATMDRDELVARRDVVELEIADIRGQLDAAVSQQKETGQYADPNWYGKAKTALRYKGIEHQQILRELSRRREQARRKAHEQSEGRARRFERVFMSVCRRRLTPDVYEEYIAETKEAMEDECSTS